MKSRLFNPTLALIFLFTSSVFGENPLEIRSSAAKCHADNCYRAAVASRAKPFEASASADCSSFMLVKATPCATTTTLFTSTATSTITTTVGASASSGFKRNVKRSVVDSVCTEPTSVTPTAVPTYAINACGPAASNYARYSSACSCKGQTQTVTTIATPTVTQTLALVATPAICDNQGVDFFYYKDDSYSSWLYDTADYSIFEPTKYDSLTPDATGQTETGTIGPISYEPSPGTKEIYGKSLDSENYVIDHQTYFVAPISGTYTIAVTNMDDYARLYSGESAYSGYGSSNYDFVASYYQAGSQSHIYNLEQGQYLPIRLFFVNAPGGANLQFSVTGPAPFDQADTLKPFFVRFSCDKTTAKEFPTLPKTDSTKNEK